MEVKEPSPRYAFKVSRTLNSSLPVDWQLTRVEDAGAVLGGRQRSPSAQGEPTPYLRVANVFAGWIDTSDVLQMPFTADERARFALRAGDILLNEGQSLELVGRSAIYRDEPPNCCFQNTLVRFRAGPRTDPNYAQYVFESYLRRGEFSKIALQTTSIAHLGAGRFAQMPFVAPPLAEQKAIGQALADADALIDSLEQLLTKKRQIKQGAMQELLTGQRRLPGFNAPWIPRSMADLFDFSGGLSASRDQLGDIGPCYLHYGDIHLSHKTHIDLDAEHHQMPRLDVDLRKVSSSALLRNGDVVFVDASEDDQGVSKHVVIHSRDVLPLISGLHTIVARPKSDELVDLYKRYCFQAPPVQAQFRIYAVGTKVSGVSKGNIGKIMLNVPLPVEQKEIAACLAEMDAEIYALESRVTKARALKQAMAQVLLTGRIRLVEPTA